MKVVERAFSTWLNSRLYVRMYIPILVLILLFSGLRYQLFIDASFREINSRSTRELSHIRHALMPALAEYAQTGDQERLRRVIDDEVRSNPDIATIRWQTHATLIEVSNPDLPVPLYPVWFLRFVPPQPADVTYLVVLSGQENVALSLMPSVVGGINGVWVALVTQVKMTAAITFIVFFLLSLLLRSNGAMLRRLARATNQFRSGDYNARMDVVGTYEGRAVAQTFNAMAHEVQVLVESLRSSQHKLSEQLHFTLQLSNALPIPVFVVDAKGICLRVNTAWENLFGVRSEDLVGQPMQGIFNKVDRVGSAESAADDRSVQELSVTTRAGKVIQTIYYKATFSTIEGEDAGAICVLVDVSPLKQAQGALVLEKERAEVTLSSIGDGVITTDLHWRVETLNTAAQQLTGWTPEQAAGRLLGDVFELAEDPSQSVAGKTWSNALRDNAVVHASNQALVDRSGKRYSIDYTASPITKVDGSAIGCVLVFRDVSEKRYLKRQIDWLASHDELTGLENRAALIEAFQQAIARAQKNHQLQAVCLLDLDHFQQVNERYSSAYGDRLLQEVASRLSRLTAEGDGVARLGGDEFVLLIGGQTKASVIENMVRRVLAELARPYVIDDETIYLTASAGIAIYPDDDVSPDTLLRHADQAMYQAKQIGRNRVHLFDADLDKEVQTQHTQRARVRSALLDGELRLHFQPKVNMRTGEIVGMEALLRWQHPDKGLLGPSDFLPMVGNTDLIVNIGEWVLRQALLQMRQWQARGMHWSVSVNIAGRHFQLKDFVVWLKKTLEAFPDVPPGLLEIEILESAALDDLQHVCEIMQACQALGVKFALDDFGTGYSSLAYLKTLPAETLKIDQTFVRNILEDQDDLVLVSAVIGLARVFNRKVIAEGVETPAHGVRLLQLGCDCAQGFGIARPMAAQAVLPWAHAFKPDPAWAAVGPAEPAFRSGPA
jgi:diguanylate cyclase (GGDEF)-like protein/PAS domain S-box-containing protein